jgi:hypothetical protein
VVTENFKALTNYTGKGILFILVSIIYMSPCMDDQQNYSSYLLFVAGIILIVADRREISGNPNVQKASENNVSNHNKINNDLYESSPITNEHRNVVLTVSVESDATPPKKTVNPYEIPDDF